MTKLKKIIIGLCVFGLAMMLGCASMMDMITPAYISKEAMVYSDANIPHYLPYTSLFDARHLEYSLDYTHLLNTLKEDAEYGFHKQITKLHISAAESFQQKMFSPTGPIGLMFPTLFGGVLGSLLIRRPGDKTKEEFEVAVNGNHNNNNNNTETS